MALFPQHFVEDLKRQADIVEETSPHFDARVRVYRLERDRFDALRMWVEDVEAFWTGQLASFKAHAERTRGRGTKRR